MNPRVGQEPRVIELERLSVVEGCVQLNTYSSVTETTFYGCLDG